MDPYQYYSNIMGRSQSAQASYGYDQPGTRPLPPYPGLLNAPTNTHQRRLSDTPNLPPNYIPFPESSLHRSASAGSRRNPPYRSSTQDTIIPGSPPYSEEGFDRNQYAISVASISPDRSPSLAAAALTQLRLALLTIRLTFAYLSLVWIMMHSQDSKMELLDKMIHNGINL